MNNLSKFSLDTRIEQTDKLQWQANFSADWCIQGVPNGGYVLAIAAKVLAQLLPHKDPLGINAYYFAKTQPGPVTCVAEILRSGGSTSHAMVRLYQDDELKVQCTAAFTDINKLHGETIIQNPAPIITAYNDCIRLPIPDGLSLPRQVQQRVVPGVEKVMMGEPNNSGEFSGWMDFSDGGEIDLFALLLFTDSAPPPVFTYFGPLGWVPTLELSVQIRARPCPGPIQYQFTSHNLTNGVVDEDGILWDSQGQLVAISRQLAKFRKL